MNDDLISRQRLLKELKRHKELFCRNRIEFLGLSKNDKARANEIDNCIATVINMPHAQPGTAKRIVGKSKDGMTLWYQCDMCNEPVDAQDNFCRGCGRRLTDG